MSSKIILSADSTCDIGPELQRRYDVRFFNYHIELGGKTYIDSVDITPDMLYREWREHGLLPKTAAITPYDYSCFFEQWVAEGYDIVHVNLGFGLSSSYQNCMLVAEELGHVYPVDSASLSTGSGLLVAAAGEMIAKGMGVQEIQQELIRLSRKTSASFVLDTLEFMAAGGRCSMVTAIGANLLRLKPCIRVNNDNGGKMTVSKKYRGSMEKVLTQYVREQLQGRSDLNLNRLFITHSESPDSDIELVLNEIPKYANFGEIIITKASCTIACHCGPRTLGVLFLTK